MIKVKDRYFLAFHPYPLVDGQCILFEKQKKLETTEILEKSDEKPVYLKDYSICGRNRIIKKNKKRKENDDGTNLIVSIYII